MFIRALFIIAPQWKQPKCPSIDEWIKKYYINTMKYYSDMKRNEILKNDTIWMNLSNFMLTKRS